MMHAAYKMRELHHPKSVILLARRALLLVGAERGMNGEGKGTLKKGNKVVRCQRCGGAGLKR